MVEIDFERGTLAVRAGDFSHIVQDISQCKWDPRTRCFRIPAYRYHALLSALYRAGVSYEDRARAYETLDLRWDLRRTPFPYQEEALSAWKGHGKRGYVVLPTGTGKSFLAVLAMAEAARSTLIMVPTLDLMNQWREILLTYFESPDVGLVGGGEFHVSPITVITYSSAYRHLENFGNRFGLVIFDECHHLPGASFQMAAEFAIAPFRLGLSATPERSDGGHQGLRDLIGPCVYRKGIQELSGDYLAEYEVFHLSAQLSAEEREEYRKSRENYISFLREKDLRLSSSNWRRFISLCARSERGRKAFSSYLRQREIAQATPAKIEILAKIIARHRSHRILIFTHDNATAYRISSRFLVPIITYQTNVKERREYLAGFNQGTYSILVTSKVLNEGVDIPAANVGVVLSGSGSVREHVQRLGRILRKHGDKKAVLYEIVSEDTAEEYTSKRRRDHEAYHRKGPDA